MSQIQTKRILAFIIDMIIVSIITSALQSMLSNIFQPKEYLFIGMSIKTTHGFSLVFYLIYFFVFDFLNQGKTLGKILFRNQVIFPDNRKPSIINLMTRTVLKIVSILILPIAILLYLFNNRFTLQDHFTKTTVIAD